MLSLHQSPHGRLIDTLPSRATLRGTLAFAATVLLAAMLASSALLTFRASDRREVAEEAQSRTLQALHATASLRVGVLGTLRGERGYLLTGDDSFLEPYLAARTQAVRDLAALHRLARGETAQQARLARIEDKLGFHIATMESMIELERSGRHQEAIRRIRAGEGRRSIEAIMGEIDRFEEGERALLGTRTGAARKASAEDALFEYLLCVVGIALLGFATAAAIALRRSLLREGVIRAELRRIAVTDELTGLANRREVFNALEWLIGAARRSERPLSIAVLDIDHFKGVNDMHGHPAGDEVIRRVARVAVEAMRDQDVVGRIGGEEFIVAMPDTDAEQARLACERLRVAISDLSILLPNGRALAITLSTGVAQFDPDDDRIRLIARADEALYEAKQQGRNRVLLAA